jgi:hypothetical protein
VGKLRKRATLQGLSEEVVEAARDGDDPKADLIRLLLLAHDQMADDLAHDLAVQALGPMVKWSAATTALWAHSLGLPEALSEVPASLTEGEVDGCILRHVKLKTLEAVFRGAGLVAWQDAAQRLIAARDSALVSLHVSHDAAEV